VIINNQGTRNSNVKRIIFFTSSYKMGLTGQLTEQALCFTKMGQGKFLFISGEKEQFPGLLKKLEQHMAPHATITGIDEHAEFSRLVRELRNVAVQFRPDFVTVHTNWQLAIAALARLLFSLDYSLVYVIHGYRHNYRFRSVIARFLIGTALYIFSDHVIAPSGFLKKQFGFLKEKNKVIFIGEGAALFDDHPLPSFSGTLRFIFAGMFRTGKNQALLIRVLKQYIVKSGNQDVELYLPGKGELLDDCRVLARKLGLEDKVFFPGFVNRAKMLALYLRCQFAFAPTNVETFGHCIVEPFILGRVVMTRRIGVADDIIRHGETGFFFDTERDLLDLLLAVLPDQALCARVAANARQAREPFRWETVCQAHFDLIYDRFPALGNSHDY
jgi:glycosyltransferase involved in cell wall biosynthesis